MKYHWAICILLMDTIYVLFFRITYVILPYFIVINNTSYDFIAFCIYYSCMN